MRATGPGRPAASGFETPRLSARHWPPAARRGRADLSRGARVALDRGLVDGGDHLESLRSQVGPEQLAVLPVSVIAGKRQIQLELRIGAAGVLDPRQRVRIELITFADEHVQG